MSSNFEEKLAAEAEQAAAVNEDNQAASGAIRTQRKLDQAASKASGRRKHSRKGSKKK